MMKFKKRFITLVEMMIVMFLIAMITGAIAYNYTGSLEEGKAFKTKSSMTKIQDVLAIYYASHPDEIESVDSDWKGILGKSQLVKNSKELEKDGWGGDYLVSRSQDGGDIEITSAKYSAYLLKKGGGSSFGEDKK
jgi:general secretion pathway protein G